VSLCQLQGGACLRVVFLVRIIILYLVLKGKGKALVSSHGKEMRNYWKLPQSGAAVASEQHDSQQGTLCPELFTSNCNSTLIPDFKRGEVEVISCLVTASPQTQINLKYFHPLSKTGI